MHAKIVALAVANDFRAPKAQALDRHVRRGMIEANHPSLAVGAQCRLPSISQSSISCEPQGETAINLDLMLLIDRKFLKIPVYGVQ